MPMKVRLVELAGPMDEQQKEQLYTVLRTFFLERKVSSATLAEIVQAYNEKNRVPVASEPVHQVRACWLSTVSHALSRK